MSEMSNRLLKLIEDKGLSYGELSTITKIPKSALQRYATGITTKIPMDRIKLLADALDVSQAYILGWDENKPAENDELILNLFKQLNDDDKQMILSLARKLSSQDK